ncbi:hypothetical protein [Mangrovibacillus cuniculi]|uniref:Uncharacterized protein n=1 Tax=Mangrovibacillus cuniculi TaxID=2593652 RepID=A0A7S8CC51_9BACI|nr:hypothetical protein [Mangrovibacillus cuniculi]QPC47126.1 hypothetical protein G8O30_09180 [Mangrovibacillus cuniculi]
MSSAVTVWHMTEEERLKYIEKHPIRSGKKHKRIIENERFIGDQIDYKWRIRKANKARWCN